MNIRYYFLAPSLYPIFCLTASLIFGILVQAFAPYLFVHFTICFCMLLLGLLCYKKIIALHPFYIFIYLSAYCFGSFSYHKTITTQQQFCAYVQGKHFNLTGTIVDIRRIPHPHMRYSIILRLDTMSPSNNPLEVNHGHENILLYSTKLHNLRVADTIQIYDVQFKKTAHQEFLYYLLKEHVIDSSVLNENAIDIIKRPPFSLSRLTHEYRNSLLHRFRKSMDKETFLAFASIFLGDPFAKKKEETLKSKLKIWGLFHYIARAGLHLVIFVSIWMFLLSLLPVSWTIRQLLMLFLCILYSIFTWPSVPFNRAFFTLLLVRTSGLFRIKTYAAPSLLAVACITLITNPIVLFALDFQLSFGVTFGLAWFNEMRYQRYRF
jgi:predicted membrane metal-binding protein